jgi:cell division ATPase FtsA
VRRLWATLAGSETLGREMPADCAVLDLGTVQTKALVLQTQGRDILVVGAGKARYDPHVSGMGDARADVRELAQSCDSALRQAEEMTERCCPLQVVPDWVVLCVPDCATVARTHTVTHQRASPGRRVTESELGDVVRRAQRLALRQLSESVGQRFAGPGNKLELLETRVAAFQIDGRGVTSPAGLQGAKLAATVLNVVAPASYLRGVEAVAEQLGLEVLRFLSSWRALASVMLGREGLCLDIGGCTTDVMLVRNGEPRATASVPLGARDFTTRLATTLGLSHENAEQLKQAYSVGRLDQGLAPRVRETVDGLLEEWVKAVETAVEALCGSEELPRHFSLCGGGSILPGISDVVRSHSWMGRLNCTQRPEVRLMEPGSIPGILDGTGQLRDPQFTCAMAAAGHFSGGSSGARAWQPFLWAVQRPDTFVDRGGRT